MLIAFAFLLASVGWAQTPPPSALDFSGFLAPWTQDCANGCGVPAVSGAAEAAAFRLDMPMNPGEVRVTRFQKDLTFTPGGEKVTAAVTMYFLCPRGAKPAPGVDSCPSRYVQAQVVLTGDARAFCAASLNPADAHPFPVLMCAGENLRQPGERLGVSLSREKTAALAVP